MSNTLEDHVLNQAATKLGFDKEEPNIKQGYGQNTSFKNLGYPQSHHQPDGWYIPEDKNAAIILETKRPSEEVTNQKHIDQLLTNCAVLATTHRNVIGILYNGKETNIFINGDHIPELSGKPLEHKSFYLNYIKDQTLDKNTIYAITQRINNNLHFKFGLTDLQDRMIFTACALVVQSRDPKALVAVKEAGYKTIHNHIKDKLWTILNHDQSRRRNDKLHILVEEYESVRMSITENQQAIKEFLSDVIEIGDMINSRHWRGEDVMGIFFNEFSRYKKKSDAGQVFTPDHITSLMYRLIGVHQDDHVLDATCGSGAFLVKAMAT